MRAGSITLKPAEKFTVVFDAIRQLMASPEPRKKRGI
jgi:hypothetical protein